MSKFDGLTRSEKEQIWEQLMKDAAESIEQMKRFSILIRGLQICYGANYDDVRGKNRPFPMDN